MTDSGVRGSGGGNHSKSIDVTGCVLETSVLRDGENPCIIFLGPIA